MGFIFKNENIKEKRCQVFLQRLYKAITNLLVLEEAAAQLIDEAALKSQIALAATNPGETAPILPFGDELVLNWNSLKFDYESISKFLSLSFNLSKSNSTDGIVYDKIKGSVLMPAYATEGEESTATYPIFPVTRAKFYNGLTIFPNLEQYEFDYKSYEILNEVYRALALILNSTESFYSTFYTEELTTVYPDGTTDLPEQTQAQLSQVILVYDTRAMDAEINGRIDTKSLEIIDPDQREYVMNLYRTTRDKIKDFTMFDVAKRLEKYIEELLFAVNGSRTYDVSFNMKLNVLEITPLQGGTSSQYVINHLGEEVFFPFHNKAILDQFTQGLNSLW